MLSEDFPELTDSRNRKDVGAPSFRSFIAEGWDSANLNRPFSDLAVSLPGIPAYGTWETATLFLSLAQDYAAPAHNGDRETRERNRREGGNCVPVPPANLSGTCPIRTFPY